MNQIEEIKKLPDWEWMPKSEQEMMLTGQGIIDQTDLMWSIGNVAVVGFIYPSYLSPPNMWFALSSKITKSDLFDFRHQATKIPKGTLTAVEASFTTGLRFAEVYGFEDTGHDMDYHGFKYKIMRRK